jgi:hypothetical protein
VALYVNEKGTTMHVLQIVILNVLRRRWMLSFRKNAVAAEDVEAGMFPCGEHGNQFPGPIIRSKDLTFSPLRVN